MNRVRGLQNVDVRRKIKQFLFLLLVSLLGMIISSALHAQDFHRAKARHFKSKYKNQISLSGRECGILDRKRNKRPKATMLVSRKPKHKTQAEVDDPVLLSSNR